MDIAEKIKEIAEKLLENEELLKKFDDEPVKVIEKLLGVDLPDDVVGKVIDGVKAKITADKAADAFKAIKKLF